MVKEQALYILSQKMKELRNKAVGLTMYDYYAFGQMVDTSPKGFNCGYAKILKKNGLKEEEKLLLELKVISSLVKDITEGIYEKEESQS